MVRHSPEVPREFESPEDKHWREYSPSCVPTTILFVDPDGDTWQLDDTPIVEDELAQLRDYLGAPVLNPQRGAIEGEDVIFWTVPRMADMARNDYASSILGRKVYGPMCITYDDEERGLRIPDAVRDDLNWYLLEALGQDVPGIEL